MEPYKILIVDDSSKNIQLAGNILRQAGYNVAYAMQAQQAWDKLNELSFNLIVLDSIMPDVSGLDLLARIRREQLDLPVLFSITHIEEKNINEFFEAGIADYVYKPFNQAELLARVKTQIQLHLAQKDSHNSHEQLLEAQVFNSHLLDLISSDYASCQRNSLRLLDELEGLPELNLSEIQSALLNQNKNSLRKLSLLQENLLALKQLGAGEFQTQSQLVKLNELVERSIKRFYPSVQQKAIHIINEIDDFVIKADERAVDLILQNLLHNAIKFSPEEAVVKLQSKSNNGKIVIWIKDQGIGLTKDVLQKVRMKNVFISTPGSGQEKGHGLGLKVAFYLSEKIGATLDIQGKLGRGTSCCLTVY